MSWAIDKDTLERALLAHAAMGLLASALLYLVCLSGTVLVLYDEWQRLEQPAAPEMANFAPSSVQRSVEEVLALEADGAVGQQVAASVYNLHFGNYGGLPVEIACILFGLALTAVCATGTCIWLGKRRRRGIAEPRLVAAWHGLVWGAPAALVATLAARFVLGNEAPFTAIFWILLALAVVLPVLRAALGQPHQPPVTA